jgi:hypothetical protein
MKNNNIWQRPVAVVGFQPFWPNQWPDPVRFGRILAILAKSGQIRPEFGPPEFSDGGQMSLGSGAGG